MPKDKQNLRLSCETFTSVNSYSLTNYVIYSMKGDDTQQIYVNFVDILIYKNDDKTSLNVFVIIFVVLIYLLAITVVVIFIRKMIKKRN